MRKLLIAALLLSPSIALAGNPGVIVTGTITPGNTPIFVNGWTIRDSGGPLSFPATDTVAGNSIAIGATSLASQTTSAAWNNISIGSGAMSGAILISTGLGGKNNIALGDQALKVNTSGYQNTAIGYQSMVANTTGFQNVSIGFNNMTKNISGQGNMSIGANALANNTIGQVNMAIGQGALNSNIGGSGNVGVGSNANFGNTSGVGNIAVGGGTLFTNTTGVENTAIGDQALGGGNWNIAIGGLEDTATLAPLIQLGTGAKNIAVGNGALAYLTVETGNTAVGYDAGFQLSGASGINTSNYNTLIGYMSGYNTGLADVANNTAVGANTLNAATSSNNVAIGFDTLKVLTSGANNTAIGYQVGSTTLTTGSNNILIGTSNSVTTDAAGSSNEINIGNILFYNKNSTAAPAVSACGTTPSIDSKANNKSGTVTVGSGVVASCTVTLAGTGYSTWNHCRVTPQTASLAAFGYSYTKTVLTITATSLTSAKFDYDCDGY